MFQFPHVKTRNENIRTPTSCGLMNIAINLKVEKKKKKPTDFSVQHVTCMLLFSH